MSEPEARKGPLSDPNQFTVTPPKPSKPAPAKSKPSKPAPSKPKGGSK